MGRWGPSWEWAWGSPSDPPLHPQTCCLSTVSGCRSPCTALWRRPGPRADPSLAPDSCEERRAWRRSLWTVRSWAPWPVLWTRVSWPRGLRSGGGGPPRAPFPLLSSSRQASGATAAATPPGTAGCRDAGPSRPHPFPRLDMGKKGQCWGRLQVLCPATAQAGRIKVSHCIVESDWDTLRPAASAPSCCLAVLASRHGTRLLPMQPSPGQASGPSCAEARV